MQQNTKYFHVMQYKNDQERKKKRQYKLKSIQKSNKKIRKSELITKVMKPCLT